MANTGENYKAGMAWQYRTTNKAIVGIDLETGKAFTAYPDLSAGIIRPDPHLISFP